ncbi:energy-coupling factor ABC transporter ATP-binding protein [Propioniciclava soli]|uniref:energy-coupling factor ABC transporter ATP-binding protein n=1 Tax=Propioniciclava soli TaxID=2775081 RepID=UPI001E4686E8|nr:energy-coupling factor ABC transporter ATP-binding protein [Propioniciclava soli]
MIRLEHVALRVGVPDASGRGWSTRTLLHDLHLDLPERRVAFVGSNGSGKSTLLRLLNGLATPTEGRVCVDGLDPATDGPRVRRHVGFVFTDPASQLVMPTPVEDVELSLRRTHRDRRARREAALALLASRGLADVAEQSIYDLSGGERQLVALTAVLAVEPAVLVLDEPTTLLDLRNRNLLHRTLAELPQQTVVATHDLGLAGQAERVVVVDAGRIVADGAPTETLAFYERVMA